MVAAILAISGFGAGCSSPTKPQVPTTFVKSAGDNLHVTVGTAVTPAPSVTIKDADGKPIAGIAVTFALATGAGTLPVPNATTDASGVATVSSWVLGNTAGVYTLTASAANVPGSPVTFSETAVAGPATTITKFGTDPVVPPAGSNVDSITVKIADQFGNAVSGAAVTFAATSGGGSVSPTSVTTGANGLAAARWTLGTAATTPNTATATCVGLASPTVTFSTTTGTDVSAVKMSAKLYVVDSLASITPGVTVFDVQGNAVANAGVTLVARAAIVTISGSTVTGAHAGQTFLVATSIDNPNAADSALVVVANIGAPVVTAAVPRFDLKTDTTFTVSLIVDMRTGTEKLGAATLQVTWDPTVLIYQSDAAGSSNPPLLTLNTSGTGVGVYTLTMADATGFAGAVELRKLTFKAASTVGKTGALSVTALDLSGVALTNFVPGTVSAFFPIKTR